MGGLSYSESHLVNKYPDLVLGGTQVMTPSEFLQEMQGLVSADFVDPSNIGMDFR